ncbi:adrenocorticotropic hormone receptor-like [Actinia tenebrosa]|uniref:Adrenocorticotropic hormone receptor-like n=1 Tax=Actinia tenebrosa TaxID=6105 RepID=A0A6P8HVK0_ACTTE|nr:adrenocorticotropic hormone receptor-like [Actinia tenebrosa]
MKMLCSFGLEVHVMFYSRVFLTIAYSVMAVTATLLNIMVLVTLWKTPCLQRPSQVLLANLAFTDLLTAAIFCPILAFSNVAVIKQWQSIFCDVWLITAPFVVCFGGMNLYTLTVVGIDRFLAIKKKFSYRTIVTNRRTMKILMAGWFIDIALQGIFIFLFYKSAVSLRSYITVAAVFIALLLCILTTFYSMAFYHLKKVSSRVSMGNTNEPTAPNEAPKFDVTKYRRTFKTIIIVVAAVFLCYSPYACILTLKTMIPNESVMENWIQFGQILMIGRSVINPLIYLWRMEDLRQSARSVINRHF